MNAESFIHRAIPADRVDYFLAHVIDSVGLSLRVLSIANDDRLVLAGSSAFGRDESEIAHFREDDVPRLPCAILIRPRREPIRTLDNPSQRRAFRQRHLARRFSEITARSRLCSVQAAAEINAVQVELHDLLLSEALLDPACEKYLEQFSAEGAL